MPHATGAHKRILSSAGGYAGGVRPSTSKPSADRLPPDRIEESEGRNQTSYPGGWFVKYPEPQNILNMPTQNAGYTDDFNVAGQPASTRGFTTFNDKLEDVLFNKDEIYVVPSYKKDFDNVGNDPDSKEYVSNYRGPKSIRQMENLRAVGEGVERFAEAAGKYYGKKVTVMTNPYDYEKVPASTRADILFVGGSTKENQPNPGYAGIYSLLFGRNYTQTKPVKRFKEDRSEVQKVTRASSSSIKLNTNLHPRYDYKQSPDWWAHVTQHEYGHSLGFGHPEGFDDGRQMNSIMSYSGASEQGAKLSPVDVNAVQEIYAQALHDRDVARRAAQNRARGAKRPKRK